MRILVIDDDPLTLHMIKRGLEECNYEVTTCDSGYKALCLLEENHYDFVLCDVFMPELSGLIVANLLRQYYDHSVPLVFMSSDKNIGALIRQRLGSSFEILNKPVSFSTLTQKIEQYTKNRGGGATA